MREKVKKALEGLGIGTHDLEYSLNNAVNWVFSSGINNMSGKPKLHGSINSWYDCDVKVYPYVYTEIAGYAITFYMYLYNCLNEEQYLERAEIVADWIKSQAMEDTTSEIKFRYYYHLDEFTPKHSYAFDTGIVLGGFTNLYLVNNKDTYGNTAKELAYWLIHKMQKSNGAFNCFYDLEEEIRLNSPDVWSKHSGPYHSKIAASLIRTTLFCNDGSIEQAARKFCDWAVEQQEPNGRFLSKTVDRTTITHPHCYACEGLLYVGFKLDEGKYIDSAVRGIQWLLTSQTDDGYISAEFRNNKFLDYVRCDAHAQTIRIIVTAVRKGMMDEKYMSHIPLLIKRLLEFQCSSTVSAESGGFYYQRHKDDSFQRHINSWATMFAIQALGLTIDYLDKKPLIDMDYLL